MLLALVVIICCAAYWLRQKSRSEAIEPPSSPTLWPILGCGVVFFKNYDALWKILLSWNNSCMEMANGAMTLTLGPIKAYMLTDPEDSMTVLNSCLEKDDFVYDLFEPMLGKGLFNGPVPVWRVYRKHLLPAVNRQGNFEEFIRLFNNQARRLVGDLTQEVDRGPVDINHHIVMRTLQSICLTSCGMRENEIPSLTVHLNEFLDSFNKNFQVMTKKIIRFQYYIHFFYKRSTLKKEEDKLLKQMDIFACELIQKRREFLKNHDGTEEGDLSDPLRGLTTLDTLLKLAESGVITEKHVRDEVNSLLFGGHDTTSHTLIFTIILLGSHPEVQERLFKELQYVFGDSNEDVTSDDLKKLVYTEAVLKEALRLYPIAPLIVRYLDRDVKLKNYTLMAGCRAAVSVYGLNRHSSWGADAESFRPERWLETASKSDNTGAFATFSLGKRACIGRLYAMTSMKTTISHLVRRFHFTADHSKMQLTFCMVLRPIAGHHVSIQCRT